MNQTRRPHAKQPNYRLLLCIGLLVCLVFDILFFVLFLSQCSRAGGLEDEVKKLAAMPSKETLIAQVLYSFNYPIMQLAIACDAIVKKAEGNEEMKVAELVAPKEAAAEEAAE